MRYLLLLVLSYALANDAALAANHSQVKAFGDFGRTALPATAAALSLLHFDNVGLWQLALAAGSAQVVTETLKRLVHEQRPCGYSHSSFPSGHTAWAFAGASFIHRRYGARLAIPGYALAMVVASSRIIVQAHHLHDVLAGAVIGIAMNGLWTKPYVAEGMIFHANPWIHDNTVGLAARLSW